MTCEHCGGGMYWFEQWGKMICGSWWNMEGGCPFPSVDLWGDWSWAG